MVKEIAKNETVVYQCEECGFFYQDKETAERCQAWCGEHQSCNLEITKYAIQDK